MRTLVQYNNEATIQVIMQPNAPINKAHRRLAWVVTVFPPGCTKEMNSDFL